MKKKLISFVLCLLMVVPLVLTSCSKSGATDTSQENATRPYKTLSFWIITEEDTTPAAAQAMQNAFNEVCKNKYSTQVQFTFCTEKEYREKLLNRLADAADEVKRQQEAADKAKKEAEELKKQGITQPATKAPTTTISDDPNNDNNYPELGAGQVDIVLINSKSLYEELAGAGMLLSLNKQLSTTYNGINAHVYPEIMKLASIDGNKYAIPNQMVIGEYTYLLVNKKLAEKYHYDASSISGNDFAGIYSFVHKVASGEDRAEIAPILSAFAYPTVKQWSSVGGNSILGTVYTATTDRGSERISVTNLLSSTNYSRYLTLLHEAELNGYYSNGTEKDFAIGFVTGDYAARTQYEDDYYCVVVNTPRITDADIYSSMFAVTKYTDDEGRSLEIIQDLLTNKELRNILQYGVQNEDFSLNSDGTVTVRSTSQYHMKQEYTGSMFTVYPCTNLGQTDKYLEYISAQNRDHGSDVFYGWESYFTTVSNGAWKQLDEYSEKFLAKLEMCVTIEEFRAVLDAELKALESDSPYKALVDSMLLEQRENQPNLDSLAGCLLAYYRAAREEEMGLS